MSDSSRISWETGKVLALGCFIDDSKHITLFRSGFDVPVTMYLFADICLSLALLAYLAGLIALVPEPVSRHACARDSLKVASVLIVSIIWVLLAMAMAIAAHSNSLDSVFPHPLLLRALIPLILIPLGIVTAASGMFMHFEPEDVPACFRMWAGWSVIVIPALLISLAGTMLHGSSSMRTLMTTLSGAISILATASTLCALRFAMLRRSGKGCTPIQSSRHAWGTVPSHPQPAPLSAESLPKLMPVSVTPVAHPPQVSSSPLPTGTHLSSKR